MTEVRVASHPGPAAPSAAGPLRFLCDLQLDADAGPEDPSQAIIETAVRLAVEESAAIVACDHRWIAVESILYREEHFAVFFLE